MRVTFKIEHWSHGRMGLTAYTWDDMTITSRVALADEATIVAKALVEGRLIDGLQMVRALRRDVPVELTIDNKTRELLGADLVARLDLRMKEYA